MLNLSNPTSATLRLQTNLDFKIKRGAQCMATKCKAPLSQLGVVLAILSPSGSPCDECGERLSLALVALQVCYPGNSNRGASILLSSLRWERILVGAKVGKQAFMYIPPFLLASVE